MFAIECENARGWYVRNDTIRLRWTDQLGRARVFDSPAKAAEYLKRHWHSGLGIRVPRIGIQH